jgi:hypothetical protein
MSERDDKEGCEEGGRSVIVADEIGVAIRYESFFKKLGHLLLFPFITAKSLCISKCADKELYRSCLPSIWGVPLECKSVLGTIEEEEVSSFFLFLASELDFDILRWFRTDLKDSWNVEDSGGGLMGVSSEGDE